MEYAVYLNRGRGTFYIKYKDPAGTVGMKAIPASIKDEGTAKVWAEGYINQYLAERGLLVVPQKEVKTIRNLAPKWEHYLDNQCRTSWKNVRQRKVYLQWILRSEIADKDLEAGLTDKDCRDWIRSLEGYPNTIRNVIQTMRSLITDLRREGLVTLPNRYNPFADKDVIGDLIPARQNKAGRNVIIYFAQREIEALCTCEAVPAFRRLRNLFSLATGARDGEINGLAWLDVSLSANVPMFKIDRTLDRTGEGFPIMLKKGEKPKPDGLAYASEPKRGSFRTVPLHPVLIPAMRWWQEHGWQTYIGRKPNLQDPVFPGVFGQYLCRRSAEYVKEDLRLASLPIFFEGNENAPFTQHAFRATFLTMLRDAGVEETIRNALAGHAGHTVAERHYVARHPKPFAEAITKLALPAFEIPGMENVKPNLPNRVRARYEGRYQASLSGNVVRLGKRKVG